MAEIKPLNLKRLLERQQRANQRDGIPGLAVRINRLDRAIALLVDNQQLLCDAMNQDFGNRSLHQSRMADIYSAVESLKYAKKHVAQWMRPEKRKVAPPLNVLGAKAHLHYQPKGVVGAISTWNFPVWVPMSPLGGIFAAGNRCMIKLSEMTPATSTLLEKLISQYFSEEELVAINGDAQMAADFSALPFDHLIFTGSTSVGKHVMKAAADNLVPVTLELGGKSPVVIGRSANLKEAARKIAAGKALNMGQVCTTPDYILVKNDSLNELIAELENAFTDMFPTILHNPDYTAVINERHYRRLQNYIEDAKQKSGEIRVINPARENFEHQKDTYKLPPTLVINPTHDMLLMQEEIFGPIIPIVGIGHVDDAIDYINERPRPLALYLFASQQKEKDRILSLTISGGVTVNDVIQHVGCEDLPFGGVGASGMGSYHAHEGFKTFSHARSVYTQSRINMMALMGMMPPYKSEKVNKILDSMIRK